MKLSGTNLYTELPLWWTVALGQPSWSKRSSLNDKMWKKLMLAMCFKDEARAHVAMGPVHLQITWSSHYNKLVPHSITTPEPGDGTHVGCPDKNTSGQIKALCCQPGPSSSFGNVGATNNSPIGATHLKKANFFYVQKEKSRVVWRKVNMDVISYYSIRLCIIINTTIISVSTTVISVKQCVCYALSLEWLFKSNSVSPVYFE